MQRQTAGRMGRGLVVSLLALWLAGCVTNGEPGASNSASRAGIAFESIDGPPPEAFEALVAQLNKEAEVRKLPVIAREGYAPYRVRAYVAASVVNNETLLSWVWDVYDGETRRATRLSGEEKAGPAGSDAWKAADEAALSRMAQSGMAQLAAFLKQPGAGENPSAPSPENAAPSPENAPDRSIAGRDQPQDDRMALAHAS